MAQHDRAAADDDQSRTCAEAKGHLPAASAGLQPALAAELINLAVSLAQLLIEGRATSTAHAFLRSAHMPASCMRLPHPTLLSSSGCCMAPGSA